MAGRLAGIARCDRSRGVIEQVGHVRVSRAEGLHGDYRGALAAQKGNGRRQVSLIEAESWAAAMADLHRQEDWWHRRANLLVEGLRVPRAQGTRIRVRASCLLDVTTECGPCHRMEEVLPGLFGALTPDWRGGFLLRVLEDGDIAIGDEVRVEA